MPSEPIKRNRYSEPPFTEGDFSARNFDEDFNEFHLPLNRMQLANFQEWGVAQGLEVSGSIGGTTLTIAPGVAVDIRGQLISLSLEGKGDIGSNPPRGEHEEVDVPIVLELSRFVQAEDTAYFVTIQFSQILRFSEGPLGRYEYVHWVGLQSVNDFTDDGISVILARVVINSNGELTELQAQRRRLVGKTVQELLLRRPQVTGEQVEQVSAGKIVATENGLQVSVAETADEMLLSQEEGNNFSQLEVRADNSSFQGNLNVNQDLQVGGAIAANSDLTVTGSLSVQEQLEVTGNAGIVGNLNVSSNLEVQGDVIARDTEHIAGNVSLGDGDEDTVTITGVVRSEHSSGVLRVDDALHATGSLTVDGNLGIGTTDLDNYKLNVEGGNSRFGGALSVHKGAIPESTNDYHLEVFSPNTNDFNRYTKIRFHQGNQYWAWLGYHGTAQNSNGEFVFWNLNRGREADLRVGTVTASKLVGDGAVFTGMIVMWSGSVNNIPVGWALCDGGNGTPDLRDRFIVGAGRQYVVGNRGGADTVTLNVNQIPSHSHSGSTFRAGNHVHAMKFDTGGGGSFGGGNMPKTRDPLQTSVLANFVANTNSAGNHTHGVSIGSTGRNQAHENRPRYYALALIIKL